MFGNTAINVALSLIFIYLLYSLLASIVQELIARIFNLRARLLTKALRRMLEDELFGRRGGWLSEFAFFAWFYELWWGIVYFFRPFFKSPFLKRFYNEPTIHYLGESKASSRPSYISPQLFSQAMMHLLRGSDYDSSVHNESARLKESLQANSQQLGRETLTHLRNLFEDAKQDVEQFRKKIEQWFDETMQRATGWYRKQTQTLLLCIGFVIAWQFNVDSIAIGKILMKDKQAREQLVALATSRYSAYGRLSDTLKKTVVIRPDTLRIGGTAVVRNDTIVQINVADTSLDRIYNALATDASEVKNILGISRGCATDSTDTVYTKLRQRLDATAARLLSPAELKKYRQAMQSVAQRNAACFTHPYQQNGWLVLAGWVLTALAVSLGAPFWFDLLNRIVKIRTGGPQPEEKH